jgi:folate-dependent phosphoribosylglycinamide formyltransferase PurN
VNKPRLFLKDDKIRKAAIFLSGSGTNAVKVLDYWKELVKPEWEPAVIITDAPDKSKAEDISDKYNLPLIAHDIKRFYNTRGLNRVSIRTEEGQRVREEWTNELRKLISEYKIDFGIFAGFIPLSNISADFPCLNIHPGDLTVEADGKRLLVGLHTIPIELAIINGLDGLRSSVIIVETYSGAGGEMDSGPILGISPSITIDLKSYSRERLIDIYNRRSVKRPIGGYKDDLEEVAKYNQELLKINGDWIVFPRAINDFAKNNFALDKENQLLYKENSCWKAVKTVVYSKNIKKIFDNI